MFDSHRPIYLPNLFSNDQVLIVDNIDESTLSTYRELHECYMRTNNLANDPYDYYKGSWYSDLVTGQFLHICETLQRLDSNSVW